VAKRVDISDYLREYRETGEILLRAKWAMDGAETLAEAAHLLRLFADELDALADAGFHLMGPVDDDYGFAHRGGEREASFLDERLERRQRPELNEAPGPSLVDRPTSCRPECPCGSSSLLSRSR
jgi:hypothetical protein